MVTSKEAQAEEDVASSICIEYIDHIDLTEVASILIGHLDEAFVYSQPLAISFSTGEPMDPVSFGKRLEQLLSHEEINELMHLPQGPGIILGVYLHSLKLEDDHARQENEDSTGFDY